MRFVIFTWLALSILTVKAAEGTATFEAAIEITPGGQASPIQRHAVTRLVDWNNDQRLDLLVGDGDGQVWIFLADAQTKCRWQAGRKVKAASSELKFSRGNTSACWVDLSGDGLRDLVVAHSDNQVAWLKNIGTATEPRLEAREPVLAATGELQLLKGCGARLDAGDCDGDGLVDLVSGHFSGDIRWYRNTGSKTEPRFAAEPIALTERGRARAFSYNVHPTLADLNQDGHVDVLYGINWGTIGCFMRSSSAAKTAFDFPSEISLASADGKLDLRSIAGDDTTPTLGDVDGDGTIDLVSGGHKGQLWLLKGVPLRRSFEDVERMLADHPSDLGATMKDDEKFRRALIGRLHGLYAHCEGFATTPATRRPVREWCQTLLTKHPQWLKHGRIDVAQQPYVPSVAFQLWTIMMLCHDGDPDATDHRRRVADAIGFQGRLRDILIEFGTLIIENGRATPNQQQTLYSYLSQISPELLRDRRVNAVTEVITIGEYLGPRLDVRNAGGVNIFASESGKVGSSENSFPKDFPGVKNDYFGLVLAHELNHRVDATRFMAVPKYNLQYWRHLRKACGPDVAFRDPVTSRIDWDATKKRFQTAGHWDGMATSWDKAWEQYWLTGPGQKRNFNVCRNETTYRPPRFGIPFFLETRQEAIASLANQYFTDSDYMFRFALDRYRRGTTGTLDEWLLMADVYSMDGQTTWLYKHENGDVNLQRHSTPLERDAQGHIRRITVDGRDYEFELDPEGLVERVFEITKQGRQAVPRS